MKAIRPTFLRSPRPISTFTPRPQLPRRIQKPCLRRQIHCTAARRYQQETLEEANNVRFRRRFFSLRRLALYATYGLGSYFFFQIILAKLLGDDEWEEDESADDARKHDGQEEDDGEEDEFGHVVRDDDGDSLFIPFQFPKQLPQVFYKNSDPEWQEFVRISGDEKRKEAVRDELAMKVGHDVASVPKLRMQLGDDLKVGRYWLDMKYPDSPPPEYSRSGIEITDEYIAWSTQIIPHSYYVQLNHIILPRALASAMVGSFRIFAHLQAVKFKTAFGFELSPMDKQVRNLAVAERRMFELSSHLLQAENSSRNAVPPQRQQGQSQSDGEKNPTPSNTSSSQHQQPRFPSHAEPLNRAGSSGNNPGRATIKSLLPTPPSLPIPFPLPFSTTSASSSAAATSSNTTAPSKSTPSPEPDRDAPPTNAHSRRFVPIPIVLDIALAGKFFLSSFLQGYPQTRLDTMPRGCFFVFGQVEIVGTTGRAKVDVHAAYEPKAAKYVYVMCKVKHVWELRQSAKGGP